MQTDIARSQDLDDNRARAAQMLAEAQSNPVQSGEQSCAIAQVHALLAIEQRLAQLCSSIQATSR